MGDKKQSTWRCANCKLTPIPSKSVPPSESDSHTKILSPVTSLSNQEILLEIRALAEKLAPLDALILDVKFLAESFKELKTSLSESNQQIKELSVKFKTIDERLTSLEITKSSVIDLQLRVEKIESDLNDKDQWSRMNNVEVKGVPESQTENLTDMIITIGKKISYPVDKSQINYVARIPTRDPDRTKPIIVNFNSRYVKEDFIAAARKTAGKKPLTCVQVGLTGNTKVYINDHLTPKNKILLSKAKTAAKERDFQYVWVKHCKIMARKSATTPPFLIKTESDLSKIL